MKKHYLKLITTISSSILSYSLVIAPFTSNASMRTIHQSPATTSGIGGNSLFRPINPAGTSSTSSKLHRPVPISPLNTKFNPLYDSDSSSVGSNSLRSVGSSSSLGSAAFPSSTLGSVHSNNGNTSHTNNTSTTSPQNTSNPSSSGNSKFRLKFTDYALLGITGMSLTGLGLGISQLVNKDNNKTNDNKPYLSEPVNQN